MGYDLYRKFKAFKAIYSGNSFYNPFFVLTVPYLSKLFRLNAFFYLNFVKIEQKLIDNFFLIFRL